MSRRAPPTTARPASRCWRRFRSCCWRARWRGSWRWRAGPPGCPRRRRAWPRAPTRWAGRPSRPHVALFPPAATRAAGRRRRAGGVEVRVRVRRRSGGSTGRWPSPRVVARQGGAMRSPRSQRAQAMVEVLGAVPVLLIVGLVLLQALAVGYAAVVAGTAAHAGSPGAGRRGDARAGARESLPGWSRAGARVDVSGGQVRVRLRPPSPLPRWPARSRWRPRQGWSAS